MPGRARRHSPRVKSGICCGTPCALIDAWLSGTGADQVAPSYTSKSGTRPSRMHCTSRYSIM